MLTSFSGQLLQSSVPQHLMTAREPLAQWLSSERWPTLGHLPLPTSHPPSSAHMAARQRMSKPTSKSAASALVEPPSFQHALNRAPRLPTRPAATDPQEELSGRSPICHNKGANLFTFSSCQHLLSDTGKPVPKRLWDDHTTSDSRVFTGFRRDASSTCFTFLQVKS